MTSRQGITGINKSPHDDVIKWKYFPRYWPFVRGIHRSPVNSPYKGQYREAGDLIRYHRAHYDVTVMLWKKLHSESKSKAKMHLKMPSANILSTLFNYLCDEMNEPATTELHQLASLVVTDRIILCMHQNFAMRYCYTVRNIKLSQWP